ncbi:hypothetical protein EV192_11317 [Actinocrispum wychmicini]|uniref:ABC-2 type transport system permease protein n=2 Tax=Actinocrispum wychmicini TaxID=1213861 RepID=A0A4V2S542_9PSEU|nr:hypothetical protein EV192_11317 [Actinocrispum wychmicini]
MRRGHRSGRRLARAGDVYMVALGVFIYGGIAIQAVRRLVARPPTGPAIHNLPVAQWLLLGCAVVALGLVVRGLLAFGPVVASGAFHFWLLATPLNRRGLLSRRFWWTAIAGTLLGALVGLGAAALLRADLPGKLISTAGGAALVLGAVALSVALQAKAKNGRAVSAALAVVGLLVLTMAVFVTPPLLDPPVAVVAAVVIPVYAIAHTYRALGTLTRSALATGAEMLSVTKAAMSWMDITMFAGIMTVRKWRGVGRVRSRSLGGTRYGAMLSADVRRLSRNRGRILAWAGLLLAPYAAVRVLPDLIVPAVQLVAATAAVSPLATGLRNVCRSPGLRRSLGGTDAGLRLVHLAVPAVLALVWTALTLPAASTVATVLAPVGAVAYTYRRATAPPVDYDWTAVDSPFGLVPPNMLRQLLRGPLLLVLLVGLQLNL